MGEAATVPLSLVPGCIYSRQTLLGQEDALAAAVEEQPNGSPFVVPYIGQKHLAAAAACSSSSDSSSSSTIDP